MLTKNELNNEYILFAMLFKNLFPPRYISVSVPALEKLYDENEAEGDENIGEIRWKLLAFIMSFPDKVISALKQLPKDYLLIGTTLYTLVKVLRNKKTLFPVPKNQNLIYVVSLSSTEWSDGHRRSRWHSLHRIQDLRQ